MSQAPSTAMQDIYTELDRLMCAVSDYADNDSACFRAAALEVIQCLYDEAEGKSLLAKTERAADKWDHITHVLSNALKGLAE